MMKRCAKPRSLDDTDTIAIYCDETGHGPTDYEVALARDPQRSVEIFTFFLSAYPCDADPVDLHYFDTRRNEAQGLFNALANHEDPGREVRWLALEKKRPQVSLMHTNLPLALYLLAPYIHKEYPKFRRLFIRLDGGSTDADELAIRYSFTTRGAREIRPSNVIISRHIKNGAHHAINGEGHKTRAHKRPRHIDINQPLGVVVADLLAKRFRRPENQELFAEQAIHPDLAILREDAFLRAYLAGFNKSPKKYR